MNRRSRCGNAALLALLLTLGFAAETRAETEVCGDHDGNGVVGAVDALIVLKRAVGQTVDVQCPVQACATTTTLPATTTTTLPGVCQPADVDVACSACAKASCCDERAACAADLNCVCLVDCNDKLNNCIFICEPAGEVATAYVECVSAACEACH